MLEKITSLVFFLFLFISSVPAHPAIFNVSSGDVTGLIAAINAANANGEENTIKLEAGTYTLTTINDPNAFNNGPVGLPMITGRLTITGAGASTTVIERDAGAPDFRLLFVQFTAAVSIDGLTLKGGSSSGGGGSGFGAGIFNNGGILNMDSSVITENTTRFSGGGLFNNTGTVTIKNTTISNNIATLQSGGGVYNFGTMAVTNSTFFGNAASISGGAVFNSGGFFPVRLNILNSTVARNSATGLAATGGGLANSFAEAMITNSTFAENAAPNNGGISNSFGTVALQNTIVARNTGREPDCIGPIISSGHNFIGDPTTASPPFFGCTIDLQSTDLTGDPGMAPFVNSGAPGNGHFPLLPGGPAIDAGNDSACPATDQLETPRRGRCDIGAIEFYPVINDLVALANFTTDFEPTPAVGAPAGTFRITAEFTNTGTQTIGHRFAEVVELAGGNLLLNADRGAGEVGARLTIPDSASTPLLPGATETFEFVIGVQTQEPFTFFVNLLGDPQIPNTSLTRLEKQ